MAENKFETAVIEQLKAEGWTERKDLSGVTTQALYDHWRDILNQNNARKLTGTPLSDTEFQSLKLELNKNKTPYDAQLTLAGSGGIGTLPLTRDDGTKLEIEIFYGDEVAGGHSRYEVVSQITFNDLPFTLSTKRRIDVMLLINGLPVAHIEEKDESLQNQWSAFEQLQKYDSDGMYTGIFSFVQVQFILSRHSAHYFARPKNSANYNKDFVFGWRDDHGQDVTDTMTFIHQVMGIPALHRLVTVNMIPDAANDNLMVMRSYQIQATRSIMDRMRTMDANDFIEKEGGYVWHTTGSGKTVTSFKVAQLLASMPKVRNVLFIVDRVDLVNQTFENFKAYAYKTFESRIQVVKGHELKKRLSQKNTASHIYLITVQGLDKAVKAGLTSDQRQVILMDEAHRSASGDAVDRIKRAFPKTTWFGFTGTPNFYSDEVHDVKTSRNVSTYDIFGRRLHRYTIKDAIGDGNVLGFDVSYYTPNYEAISPFELDEQEMEKQIYTSLIYRQLVVDDIAQHWDENHSGPIQMGRRKPNQFHGLFAVSGKQAVVAYYHLFKKMVPNLRVAMTYSHDEDNGAGTSDLQAELKQAMTDYAELYQTRNFLEDTNPERGYLNDITKRLAHKKPYNQKLNAAQEQDTPQRLDLVIVSDQLLTGFDSKYVNTIYIDKILKEGPLIQAMSRTNRTIDKNAKPHGKVRFYRKGDVMEENVKNALVIYTKGGNDTEADAEKQPDDQDQQQLIDDDILAPKQATQIEDLQPKVERLKEIAGDDFSQTPKSESEQLEFATLAAEVNQKVQRLVQQGYELGTEVDKFDDHGQPTGDKIGLEIKDDNEFSALQARMNDVNELLPPEKKMDLANVQIAIDLYRHEIIDYDMLVALLNAYMDEMTEENHQAVEEHITPMDDDSRTEIEEILDGIENHVYTTHFDTESLKEARQTIRTEKIELKIRRWSADNGANGNAIVAAYDLFLPGVSLNDNPQLKAKIIQIEQEQNLGFFETADFEDGLMRFFSSLA
ncbi:type I restriction endonuclease subunit R [Levilactobacillus acidifarinae]|uniref:type I site-specific deoxyribonuclease n=1 Tax=Levilactobacillus acidifarinae DSM 19394 = JCM 15949 TaxID=1423715 RepID=A0A0R1LPT7_9LACO|nr:type I restriction endonuclease subunit R [Levilactobacillus acidifarinae]KRK95635.1 type I site-specific deoxyribonuclease restriction subunit [Levilactobacillus acidifarinae DSM 19394]GEO69370.1 type I restriction enzyme R protein [Levilactobacillus acidifarinae]